MNAGTAASPADLITAATAARARGECVSLPLDWFFPERDEGSDNHGARAKAACALCPVREVCLLGAVAGNEPAGIWGGAGEARRRRIRAVRGDEALLRRVLDAHWRQLDGVPLPGDQALLSVFGDGATHGRRCTQAKGCRCEPCGMAASFEGAVKALKPKKPRRPRALAVAA